MQVWIVELIAAIVVFFIIVVIYVTSNREEIQATRNSFALGTIIHLKAVGNKAEEAIEEAINRINEIDDKMSAFKENSDISRINSSAGLSPEVVSEETFKVLEKSVYYSRISEGTFDPTVRPLVELWNMGSREQKIPDKREIEDMLKLVNYRDIVFDRLNLSIKLKYANQRLDLGGIAKGYAADEVRDIFRKYKITSGLIDLGGNIYAVGNKENREPWKIGIQNPFKGRGEFVAILNARNKSIVTSGNYEKYFISEGKKYHHILDVNTGFPSESEIISSTIISDNSIDGDGLSTGTYILGVKKALKIIEAMDGIDGIFITKDKKIYATEGIKDSFVVTDAEFIDMRKQNNQEVEES